MYKPVFFMMVGLPASGKSYYAKKLEKDFDAITYSSDAIREELAVDINCQDKNTEVFELLHKRIKESLISGHNTIYDATNINYKKRMAFLNEIRSINCYPVCYFMATPYLDCVQQNINRDHSVPIEVIEKMYENIYIPQNYEGWDDIVIIQNYDIIDFNTNDLFNGENGLNKLNQDNPYHTLTVGKHCIKCAQNLFIQNKSCDYELFEAAFLHDIGKPFTKSFTNYKGEDTIDAHYYQHHLVSAYDSLFYSQSENKLLVANYIQWHMNLYFLKTTKSINKFKNLVGEDFFKNLELLHQADILAK